MLSILNISGICGFKLRIGHFPAKALNISLFRIEA